MDKLFFETKKLKSHFKLQIKNELKCKIKSKCKKNYILKYV